MTDEALIASIASGKNINEAVEQLYGSVRKSFLRTKPWDLSYGVDRDDLVQEAIMLTFEKIRQGGLKLNEGATLNAYVVGVFKNLARNEARKSLNRRNKEISIQDDHVDNSQIPVQEEREDEESSFVALQSAFNSLSPKCQSLIKDFYGKGLTYNEIASQTGSPDEGVLKVQKYRCPQQLKRAFFAIKQRRG